MRRREFIALFGGAVAALLRAPPAARAQQAMPVVGILSSGSANTFKFAIAGVQRGLMDAGYAVGRNVDIEYRWADGQYDRLPALAADLIRREVAVIVAGPGGIPAALAVKAATATIPIVFAVGGDPVRLGLVASLNRPGGNLTGVNTFSAELGAKGLGLLLDLVPRATTVAVLVNATNANGEPQAMDVQAAARAIGRQVLVLRASTESEIDAAYANLGQKEGAVLVVSTDAFLLGRVAQITMLAARYSVPTIYPRSVFVEAGGLMSYGSSESDSYRQVGVYVGQILKGTKPADLPVQLPTKFELVINLKTAKALGLTVPPGVLAIADEVIE